jgi:hypothetical protein
VSGGSALPPVDTIRRDEVNAVLANQRELVSAARDIKNFVTDVHSKVTNIQAGLAINKPAQRNPPKKPKETHLKKPLKVVFLIFYFFYENNRKFSL